MKRVYGVYFHPDGIRIEELDNSETQKEDIYEDAENHKGENDMGYYLMSDTQLEKFIKTSFTEFLTVDTTGGVKDGNV